MSNITPNPSGERKRPVSSTRHGGRHRPRLFNVGWGPKTPGAGATGSDQVIARPRTTDQVITRLRTLDQVFTWFGTKLRHPIRFLVAEHGG